MRQLLFICSGLLFLSIANLPIGFYTFLRIVVTIGAVLIVSKEYEKGINLEVILFGITAILFNPLIPVYLIDKSIWIPIDIMTGGLFLFKGFKI